MTKQKCLQRRKNRLADLISMSPGWPFFASLLISFFLICQVTISKEKMGTPQS
jgi:hypothetical protein